jgi:hypothetical protein
MIWFYILTGLNVACAFWTAKNAGSAQTSETIAAMHRNSSQHFHDWTRNEVDRLMERGRR